MFTSSSLRRDVADACPGALRLHAAADGPLARVRLPGGLITGAQLATLGELAHRWGDGHVELTSRANVQLRALTGVSPGELAARLWAAGLLPSESHELVRNIAASPIPPAATRAAVAEMDARLCADAALARLPGRFLFALDDGRGDVAPSADVAAVPDGPAVAVLFAGHDLGLRIPPEQSVAALLAAAHAFLAVRAGSGAWRVRELPDGPGELARRTAAALGTRLGPGGLRIRPSRGERTGPLDHAAGALVPLGRLGSASLTVLATGEQLVVTAQREVIVADLAAGDIEPWLTRLARAGLVVEPGSPWAGVTTCAGRPGCAKALADVRADAAAAVAGRAPGNDGRAVHWVGCARGCGTPAGPHVRVEATGDGYAVTAPGHPLDRPVSGVAAARRT